MNDQTAPSSCLIFFRPSFGRSGGEGSAQFGEFDSVLASLKNVYLIESKWDNLSQNQEVKIELSDVQILRHEIFSWYFMSWSGQQYSNWGEFSKALQNEFQSKFIGRKIAPVGSILARNLEFVLSRLHEHCGKAKEPKNVLLYYYNSDKSKEVEKVTINGRNTNFEVINIDINHTFQVISFPWVNFASAKKRLSGCSYRLRPNLVPLCSEKRKIPSNR